MVALRARQLEQQLKTASKLIKQNVSSWTKMDEDDQSHQILTLWMRLTDHLSFSRKLLPLENITNLATLAHFLTKCTALFILNVLVTPREGDCFGFLRNKILTCSNDLRELYNIV